MLDINKLRAEYEATLPPLVLRKHIAKCRGGRYTPQTMQVYDSQGKGPGNKIRRGRDVCYPKADLIDWVISQLEDINA